MFTCTVCCTDMCACSVTCTGAQIHVWLCAWLYARLYAWDQHVHEYIVCTEICTDIWSLYNDTGSSVPTKVLRLRQFGGVFITESWIRALPCTGICRHCGESESGSEGEQSIAIDQVPLRLGKSSKSHAYASARDSVNVH